ncbi:hypothetical protein [Streptomyces sp. SID1121]|uniref:hypothetical protein n=1 Tax=Streptomyces sp. SID1121 TaxID=3425888 RepID=UPI0040563D58
MVPGAAPGLGHTALGAVQAPPPGAVVAGDLLTPGPAPHTGAPGGAHPVVGTGPHFRPAASGGVSALDLVAGGRAGPDLTVTGVSGAGSGLAERTTSALTANQVRLHLGELVQMPGGDMSRTGSTLTGTPTTSPIATGPANTSAVPTGPATASVTAGALPPGTGPGAVPQGAAFDAAGPATAGRIGTSQATTGLGTGPVTAGAVPPGSGSGSVPYSPVLDTGGPATAGRAGSGTGASGPVATGSVTTGPGVGSVTAATTGAVPPGSAPGGVPHGAAVDTAGPVTTGAVPAGSGAGAVAVRPGLDAGGAVTAGPVTTNAVTTGPGTGPVTAGVVPPGAGAGAASHGSVLHPGGPGPDVRPPVGGGDHGSAGAPGPHGSQGPRPAADMPVDGGPVGTAGLSGVGKGKAHAGVPAAGPGAGVEPGAPVGSRLPHEPGTAVPLADASHRLTPDQIARLWARDADRVDALFGEADDPLREVRRDAWRDFAQARHDLGRNQALLREGPASTSSGPSVHDLALRERLDTAGQHYTDAHRRLTDLGVDPAAVDRGMRSIHTQSLLERPRLDGGMFHTDHTPQVHPQPQPQPQPHGIANLLAGPGPGPHTPPAPPVPLRGFDGQPTGQVLHVDPAGGGPRLEGPGGAAVELRDGRVRVAGPDGGYRDFDATGGQLLQERLPLYGPDGRPFHRAAVDVGPGGTYALHQGGGRQLDVLGGGGFRVSDPATGATAAFDARGAHLADGTRLRGPGGHFAPGDEIVTAGAGGRTVTALDGTPLPGRQVRALDGGGLRVTDPATGASARFTPQGIEVERGIALARADGTPVHAVANADGGHRLTDLDGGRLPGRIAADPDSGGFRVADGQGPGHQLYGPDGAHTGRGMPLTGRDGLGAGHLDLRTDGTLRWVDDPFAPTAGRAADRAPGGQIEVTLPGGGHQVFDPASGALLQEVTPLPGGAGTRTEWAGHHSVRQGEFMEVRADGSPLRQGVNVVQDGRRTDFQYVVDFPAGGGRATWHRTRVGADGGAERAVSGTFHQGAVKSYGPDGSWLRLDSSTGKGVEVFQRRVLPGGDVLDAFRRTDSVGFGHFNRRTVWVRWGDDGALRDWGTRHYDTAGTGWRDLPHTSLGDRRTGLTAVREYRDGLQAYDNGAGHVLAVRDDAGTWTWHRYDGGGGHLAEGPRTHDLGGGWTDRDATGAVVQRQWGSGHLPQDARHFQENRLASQDGVWNRTDLWERQSPHGKESGKYEQMGPGTYLRTERLGEQRPPAWFRDHFMADVGHAPPTHAHLGGDNRFQMFLWSKEAPGVDARGGARYVGMDGGSVDLSAGGDFVRSTNKLHNGNTLKVGDHAPRPAHDPTPGTLAWHEGGAAPRGGYRFESPAGGRTLWEDRIAVDGVPQGQWPVAREGLPGGLVREYADPPAAHQPREAGSWVTRDAHGNLTGIQHPSRAPRVAGQGDLFVRGTGDPDASAWTWKLVDAAGDDVAGAGGPVAGRREFFRGSTDPALAWDDSFRDFDAAGNLVRERRMLDGGGYVDAWADGDRWLSAKYRRDGQAVDFGGGTQVRQWWHGGAWQDDWARGARHWQDVLRPQGGADTTLRSVPVHTNGPLRVREYRADGQVAAADGVWKEFDHGSVVRERKALGDGTFLETDAWRGQWRRYDAHGGLLAQRTDSGLVFESRGGQLHLTGNEYDFRGPLTELRGWGRRVREAQRMPWSGTPLNIGESLYQPYWQTVAGKAALEFGQEFVLEFGANLAVNGIVAAVQNKPFTGKDALKAFANAAVSAGIKTGVGTMIHENSLPLFRDLGSGRAGLANVDGGKHWGRAPMNHDKTWANEWGGNETATRWRGGAYDFGFGVGTSVLAGWVNGSMNAAVWGITDAEGNTVKLTGWDAVGDGGINALASLTTSVSTGLAKNIALLTTGGRLFHRQGFADFWLQLPFKIFEKSISSLYLTSPYRASINPAWYQVPPPASQNP